MLPSTECLHDPEAKSLAQGAIDSTHSFSEDIELINCHYEYNRILHRHFFENLTKSERFSCKVEDLVHLKTKLSTSCRGMEESKGFTAGHLVVEMIMEMLDKQLMQNWMQYTHKSKDPPDLNTFLAFLDYQCTIMPMNRLIASAMEKTPKLKHPRDQPRRFALKLQETASSTYRQVSCVTCACNHALFSCTKFKRFSVQDRWSKVKQHKL